MADPLRTQSTTGTAAVTLVPLMLSFDQAKMVHEALYLAYGNEDRALELWDQFRRSMPESWWRAITRA